MVRDSGRSGRLQADLARPDADLLERFVRQRDEAAFEALLHRHGPLVFGVCRRLLYDPHDALDAFQATFLVLARKAGSVGRRALLGNWLYGVAYKVAARARKQVLRRRLRERTDTDLTAVPEADRSAEGDLTQALHEEVQRLPEKYRTAVVLCYLEGKTSAEAAAELSCPVSTVKGRLALARERLRTRLTRRGATLAVGLLVPGAVNASVPTELLKGTFQAAVSFAAGDAAAGGAASAQAVALTQGVLRTMLLSKLKNVAAVLLSVLLVAGFGGLAYHSWAGPQAKDKVADKAPDDHEAILGTWKVEKAEVEGEEPDDAQAGVIKGLKMTFTKEKIVTELPDGTTRESTYKLDPTKKPKAIDINYQGREVTQNVYALEGDTLKVCGFIPGKGAGRPTEVGSKEGSGTMLITLKRQAK
jgi:RNA polymerase sigma factor (sigma-70 family)